MIYDPKEDSFLLANAVKKYSKNKKVLDIGTGSGIQAEMALKAGAKEVLAADIEIESINSARKKGLRIIKSNLFQKIKDRFDLIIFNPPYLPEDKREDKESRRATTGGKHGDEIILRFINSLPKYLNKKGIALLLISSITPKSNILQTLKNNSLKKKIISSQSLFMETLDVWEITKKVD